LAKFHTFVKIIILKLCKKILSKPIKLKMHFKKSVFIIEYSSGF
jgi:hypothetical protein